MVLLIFLVCENVRIRGFFAKSPNIPALLGRNYRYEKITQPETSEISPYPKITQSRSELERNAYIKVKNFPTLNHKTTKF